MPAVATYRLLVGPRGSLVTRDIEGGIKGPWLQTDTATTQAGAAAWLLRMGYEPTGTWVPVNGIGEYEHAVDVARIDRPDPDGRDPWGR
jgi:hypothetical protein